MEARWWKIAGALAVAFAAGFGARAATDEGVAGTVDAAVSPGPSELSDHELATIALFERVEPSVVYVTSLEVNRG